MDAYYEREPLTTAVSFFFLYVIITGLSLPGAAILTLAAGAIFGVLWGTIVVSFASTIGQRSHSWSHATCSGKPYKDVLPTS